MNVGQAVIATSSNTDLIANLVVTYDRPNPTGSLAYTPLSNTSGTAIVTVTVTDDSLDGSGNGDVGSVQKTFALTVN